MITKLVSLIKANPVLALVGGAGMIDASLVISGLAGHVPWRCWFLEPIAGSVSNKLQLTDVGIVHVVGWTIVPPVWFFLETFTIDDRLLPGIAHSTDPALKAEYDRLRIAQELASKVWAAVLASILFLVPK